MTASTSAIILGPMARVRTAPSALRGSTRIDTRSSRVSWWTPEIPRPTTTMSTGKRLVSFIQSSRSGV